MKTYHEIYDIEEVMLPYTQRHMTKMENGRTGMREVEANAVSHTLSKNKVKHFTCTFNRLIPII